MPETAAEINRLEGHKVMIFARNVDLVGQQKMSRFVNHVDADLSFMESGDRYTDELMGTSDPVEVLQDVRPTPGGEVDKFRRIGFFKTFEDGKWIGTREKAEQLVDPTNPVVRAMGAGRERRRDATILKSFYNPQYVMDKNGDPIKKNFPTSRVIAVDDWTYYKGKADGDATAPTSDTGLTVAKLRSASVMRAAGKLDGGEWCVGVEEADLQHLLTSIETSSKDYEGALRLLDGDTDKFKSWTFVRAETDALKYDSDTTTATIPFWNSEQILYKERPLVGTRVQERPDMSYRWHAFYEAQDSWMRRQDVGVGHILCKR